MDYSSRAPPISETSTRIRGARAKAWCLLVHAEASLFPSLKREQERDERDPACRTGVASSANTTVDKVAITNVADARRRLLAGRA